MRPRRGRGSFKVKVLIGKGRILHDWDFSVDDTFCREKRGKIAWTATNQDIRNHYCCKRCLASKPKKGGK